MTRGFNNRLAMEAFHPKMVSIATRHVQGLRDVGLGDDLLVLLQDFAIDVVWALGLGMENASRCKTEWLGPFKSYVQLAASVAHPLHHTAINLACGRGFAKPDYLENDVHKRIEACVVQILGNNFSIWSW